MAAATSGRRGPAAHVRRMRNEQKPLNPEPDKPINYQMEKWIPHHVDAYRALFDTGGFSRDATPGWLNFGSRYRKFRKVS